MKRDDAEWLACMLIASAALVYSIWVVPYIPTQDGPQHILSAHIENHYSDPESLYPEFYRILPQFAGKGFSLVFGLFESFMPWRLALRVTLSVISLAFAWGFALVVLALGSASTREERATRRPVTLLGFAVALPWALYMGFFAFVVGTTVGLYTLAFVLRRPTTTTSRRLVLSLLLLVQGVCHVFTAILTGVVVLVLALAGAPKGGRLREAGRMALVGAPAALLFGLTFYERSAEKGGAQPNLEWGGLSSRLGVLDDWFVPGSGLRAWLVIALVIATIGVTLAHGYAKADPAAPALPRAELALAWLAGSFVLMVLFGPLHIPGWQHLAPRFALLATVLGLALLRLPKLASPLASRAVLPALTVFCIVSSVVSARFHRQLADGCADSLAGLDAPLEFHGPRLPVVFQASCGDPAHPPVYGASMAFNTPLLYLLDHGGIAARPFSGAPSIHALEIRHDGRMPPAPDPVIQAIAQAHWLFTDPQRRASALTELAADGMAYEGIHIVGGRPEDAAFWNARGYVTELLRGPLFIGRFEGCPAELLLPPGALDAAPVYYEYGLFHPVGLFPEPRTTMRKEIDRSAPVKDGAIRVPLAGRPCGDVLLRVVWDVDRSSTFTPGDRTCAAAVREGRMVVSFSRDRAAVTCVPSP